MNIRRRSIVAAGLLGIGGALAGGQAHALSEADLFPVVETVQGRVRGVKVNGVTTFRGLHYGGDTSGKNRFMPPPPARRWAGIRDTYEYGQNSPQNNASHMPPGGMGEDCLVLNIWTSTTDRNGRRPVLVRLHGGGLVVGSGNEEREDGEELARFGDCVTVSVNHRLGLFGALDLADHGAAFANSGQVGMLDLVAALQWIQDNIAGFGGDPSRVLIFGLSGGGEKGAILMAMPSAKGLFHRVGIQSSGLVRLPTADQAQARAARLVAELGMAKADVGALQSMSMERLLAARASLGPDGVFDPSIDGRVIPSQPFDPAAPAVSANVPLIISTSLDERSYLMHDYDLDEVGLRAYIAKRVGEARADEVLALYREDDPYASAFILQARFNSDEGFRKPMDHMTDVKAEQATKGGAPVWRYLWREPTVSNGGRLGSPHGSDHGPSLHDLRGGINPTDGENRLLADRLAAFWVSFAATGDPNNSRGPAWPPYTLPERATLVFDRHPYVVNDPRSRIRKFWEAEPSIYDAGKPYRLGVVGGQ